MGFKNIEICIKTNGTSFVKKGGREIMKRSSHAIILRHRKSRDHSRKNNMWFTLTIITISVTKFYRVLYALYLSLSVSHIMTSPDRVMNCTFYVALETAIDTVFVYSICIIYDSGETLHRVSCFPNLEKFFMAILGSENSLSN